MSYHSIQQVLQFLISFLESTFLKKKTKNLIKVIIKKKQITKADIGLIKILVYFSPPGRKNNCCAFAQIKEKHENMKKYQQQTKIFAITQN